MINDSFYPSKGSTFMRGDMITLITFYFKLWILFASMMYISFIIEILCMYFHNSPCHPAGFGIPAYMISNFQFLLHYSSPREYKFTKFVDDLSIKTSAK
jgi:hypothetical protein